MDYRNSVDLSGSHTQRASGGGGDGRMALGGDIGELVLMLLIVFAGPRLGVNVSDLFGSGSRQDTRPAAQGSDLEHYKQKGVNVSTNRECRWPLYEKVIQDYWSKTTPNYEYATVKLFSGTISTAYGVGQTEMGSFHCSGDPTVYIDDSHVGQLLKQLGASGGNVAELYIVAHEFRHHVQSLDGTMRKARRGTGADSSQVRLELQVDCYTGVAFNQVMKDSNSLVKAVNKDDLLRIVDAARSVSDGHIQK